MVKVLRALLLVAARCTQALKFLQQQEVVFLKLTSIDLKRNHPTGQEVDIDALVRSCPQLNCYVAEFPPEVKQPCVFPKS